MKKKRISVILLTALICCFPAFGQTETLNLLDGDWSFGKIVAVLFVLFIAFIMCLIFFKVIASVIQEKRNGGDTPKTAPIAASKTPSQSAKASDEVYAAIAMALYESDEGNIHDMESAILTLKQAVASYSPWSSKIYGLREIPLKK